MTLTKSTKIDKIEIVTEYKHIQIRTETKIYEDGNTISTAYSRKVLQCGYLGSDDTYHDTNLTGEDPEIVNIANVVWTQEVKNVWKEKLLRELELNNSMQDVAVGITTSIE